MGFPALDFPSADTHPQTAADCAKRPLSRRACVGLMLLASLLAYALVYEVIANGWAALAAT